MGTIGGVTAQMQGGNFGNGFLTAGGSALVGGATGLIPFGKGGPALAGRVLVAAVVGGTFSELTGGKFANGALTAGFTALAYQAVNAAAGSRSSPDPDPKDMGLSAREQAARDAGKAKIDQTNPTSIDEDREYGGLLWEMKEGGEIGATRWVRGPKCNGDPQCAGVNPWLAEKYVPKGARVIGMYHTHGRQAKAGLGLDYNQFSGEDVYNLDMDALVYEGWVGGFVGTPNGSMYFYRTGTLDINLGWDAYTREAAKASQIYVGRVRK